MTEDALVFLGDAQVRDVQVLELAQELQGTGCAGDLLELGVHEVADVHLL